MEPFALAIMPAPAQGTELKQFKEHIELYEMIKGAAVNAIMPSIRRIEETVSANTKAIENLQEETIRKAVAGSLRNSAPCPSYSGMPYPVHYSSSSSDSDWLYLFFAGFAIGAVLFFIMQKEKLEKKMIQP